MKNQLLKQEIFNNLPETLKRIITPFEGRERDVILLSSISVLSASIPNVFGIYGNKKLYSNLYLLIIAPPASGKGAMNYSRNIIQPIHKKVMKESSDRARRYREEGNDEKVPLVTKIIPANISSSEIYSTLKNVDDSGVMIESEADTLSVMFKNDWGNFSDVLRKAFHHEPISISRKKDNYYMELETPKLSLALSGTPDQIQPLIQSKENGLFSRFMYYKFDDIENWKDVFESKTDYNSVFSKVGNETILPMYEDLRELETEIQFEFPEELQKEFNKKMSRIFKIVNDKHPRIFSSNVKRYGLILFRIAMILTVLRNKRTIKDSETITCIKEDFDTAYLIVDSSLHHALDVLYLMGEAGLPALDELILNDLQKSFTRGQAVEIGQKHSVPVRTIDDKLTQWISKKIIKKIARGNYEKSMM